MNPQPPSAISSDSGALAAVIRFFLDQKLVAFLLLAAIVIGGMAAAPFDWDLGALPRAPVPVDAIPNLGENQQIVLSQWPGRSPQDVEDQVTFPLTVSLLGVPGVHEVRSISMFGTSLVFLIFNDDVEFYWSRARIIEKLNSLPSELLPADVQPTLGPDATALGQVFWYTLEGRDPDGNVTGGWDLHELRSIQDWTVRYALLAAEGISEVASIGGYVREYQIDVDPDALRAYDVTLAQVVAAVRNSNLDIGAGVTEINRVEYVLRGLGFVRNLADLEQTTVRAAPGRLPVRVQDVATVSFGPAQRRGALTKLGAEAVGGVVVVREGYNPLAAIGNVKQQIQRISTGLPARVVVDWQRTDHASLAAFAENNGFSAFDGAQLHQENWLQWLRTQPRQLWPEAVTISQLEIVAFYDRSKLIGETLATLNDALVEETLVVVLVILILIMHLPSALIVSAMLPLAILICFILMKLVGVDSNLVSLAGIAISIGVIADMGIVLSENVRRHLADAEAGQSYRDLVLGSTNEVATALLTAISTTVIGFLPVFTMTGAEGKLFTPLAYTWTFVLFSSILVALTIVPALLHLSLGRQHRPPAAGDMQHSEQKNHIVVRRRPSLWLGVVALLLFAFGLTRGRWLWLGIGTLLLLALAAWPWRQRIRAWQPFAAWLKRQGVWCARLGNFVAIALVLWLLTRIWEPLGPARGLLRNLIFVGLLVAILMLAAWLLLRNYHRLLGWVLAAKALFLVLPLTLLLFGSSVWLGFERVFAVIPTVVEQAGIDSQPIRHSRAWVWAAHAWPGLGREFMPALDEGAFLWMPTTMPHASLGEVLEVMQYQDMAMASVPEVEEVIGKLGRVESALDPAPISMIETVIHYKPEYVLDAAGRRIKFRYDRTAGEFVRDADGELIVDPRGRPYRQWRDHIRSANDIWNEIVKAAEIPGTTSAPKLQPIETRLVMLQTGMRAPMGIKLHAPDLATLDQMAVELERHLRQVPVIRAETVNAERIVGKPYLEIAIDRAAISRYGLNVVDVQQTLATAVGGTTVTTTVEGRQRYPVRVRYGRELRHNIEALEQIIVAAADGTPVPLAQLATINYNRGPQMIRGENTFLTAYITFAGVPDLAEVNIVEAAQAYLADQIAQGNLLVPDGVSWRFAGAYEHQLRAMATLRVVLPLSLTIIFLILYFQFRSVALAMVVFSSVAVAWAGGFVMLYFYGQDWFANFALFGVNMRELFQLQSIHLSVAVWVGFLALFGIAVDDGVLMATYIEQRFAAEQPSTTAQIRACVIAAGQRRIRPCLMTSATTLLALLPVLTSTGRGADLLIPMALPIIGGITLGFFDWFTVPVLVCALKERQLAAADNSSK